MTQPLSVVRADGGPLNSPFDGNADADVPRSYRELREARAALAGAVPVLRRRVRAWLRGAGLDPITGEALVLAVDEAVTNAVEHGHRDRPGLVRLVLTRADSGETTAVVADAGTWRPIPEDPGFRGRGLALIDRLADDSHVSHGPHGTTVHMTWYPG